MRFASWINKATDTHTHSEHVMLIAFSSQQWLRERASMLRYTYVACLVTHIIHATLTGIYPPKAQWSLYAPPGLTFTNSTFCPHSVFMCFVWISEQTAIISLYSIN
jgi:hypothetical protein